MANCAAATSRVRRVVVDLSKAPSASTQSSSRPRCWNQSYSRTLLHTLARALGANTSVG